MLSQRYACKPKLLLINNYRFKNGSTPIQEYKSYNIWIYIYKVYLNKKFKKMSLFSHVESQSDQIQIEGLGAIVYKQKNQRKMLCVGPSPSLEEIDRILGPLYPNTQMRDNTPIQVDRQMLIKLRTGEQLTRETKKKVNGLRKKKVSSFLKKSNDRYAIVTCEKIIDKLMKDKRIKDPSKSLTFFFLHLVLLREYRSSELFLSIFDQIQRVVPNKKSKEQTQEEYQIICEEMNFFKQVAIQFYETPLRAILMAYLRNHDAAKLRQGKMDKSTRDGIFQTIKLLNEEPFHLNINMELAL